MAEAHAVRGDAHQVLLSLPNIPSHYSAASQVLTCEVHVVALIEQGMAPRRCCAGMQLLEPRGCLLLLLLLPWATGVKGEGFAGEDIKSKPPYPFQVSSVGYLDGQPGGHAMSCAALNDHKWQGMNAVRVCTHHLFIWVRGSIAEVRC